MLGSLLHPLALTSTALLKNLASLALVVTSATYCSALVVFRKVPISNSRSVGWSILLHPTVTPDKGA